MCSRKYKKKISTPWWIYISLSQMSLVTIEEKRLVVNQVKALDQLQQRMFRECHQKCIPKPRDGDLSVAEMSCIDRCVPKYLETHALVGNEVDNIRRALAAPTVATDNSR